MRRIIKFRAWDKVNKRMEYVGAIQFTHPRGTCPGEIESIGIDKYDAINDPNEFELMQFTGLKDKNGKDVFEGDILHYYMDSSKRFPWTVSFENGCFVRSREFRGGSSVILNDKIDGFEVIGNIYETPELMENK